MKKISLLMAFLAITFLTNESVNAQSKAIAITVAPTTISFTFDSTKAKGDIMCMTPDTSIIGLTFNVAGDSGKYRITYQVTGKSAGEATVACGTKTSASHIQRFTVTDPS